MITLKQVQIELTSRCNLSCPLCHSTKESFRPPENLAPEAIISFLSEMDAEVAVFNLYGKVGEPLLYPGLPVLVRAVHELFETKTRISTNGHALTERLGAELIEAGLVKLMVALDGATAQVYRRYRRGGDFQLLCRNIMNFARIRAERKRPRLIAQFIPMAHNEHEFDDVVDLAGRLGCDEVRVKLSGSVFRSAQFRPVSGRFSLGTSARGPCGLDEIYIDAGGTVYPCCHLAASENPAFSLGNCLDTDFRTMLASENYVRLKTLFAQGQWPEICRRKCVYAQNKQVISIRLADGIR